MHGRSAAARPRRGLGHAVAAALRAAGRGRSCRRAALPPLFRLVRRHRAWRRGAHGARQRLCQAAHELRDQAARRPRSPPAGRTPEYGLRCAAERRQGVRQGLGATRKRTRLLAPGAGLRQRGSGCERRVRASHARPGAGSAARRRRRQRPGRRRRRQRIGQRQGQDGQVVGPVVPREQLRQQVVRAGGHLPHLRARRGAPLRAGWTQSAVRAWLRRCSAVQRAVKSEAGIAWRAPSSAVVRMAGAVAAGCHCGPVALPLVSSTLPDCAQPAVFHQESQKRAGQASSHMKVGRRGATPWHRRGRGTGCADRHRWYR